MLLGFSQCDNHTAFEVKLHCCNVSFDGGKFLIWPKEKVAKVCESVGMLAERHSIKAPSYLSCPDAKFSLAHPPWPDNGAAWSLNVHAHARTNPRSPRVLTLLIYICILRILFYIYCIYTHIFIMIGNLLIMLRFFNSWNSNKSSKLLTKFENKAIFILITL